MDRGKKGWLAVGVGLLALAGWAQTRSSASAQARPCPPGMARRALDGACAPVQGADPGGGHSHAVAIARGTIYITADADRASAFLDGVLLGPVPQRVASVAVGNHVVEVRAEGRRPFTREVQLGPRQLVTVAATLEAVAAPPANNAPNGGPPTPPPSSGRRDVAGDGVDSDGDGLDCQAGAASDGTYFVYCPTVGLTQPEARARCQRAGYELASLRSQEEERFIDGLMEATRRDHDPGAWLGLTDEGTEGTFRWLDGSGSAYRNWWQGEPNNSGGHEDCVYRLRGQWNDSACDFRGTEVGFLCEQRRELRREDRADDGVDSDGDGLDCEATAFGSSYLVYCTRASTWAEAQATCRRGGYDLVRFGSAAEMQAAVGLMVRSPRGARANAWLGLTDDNPRRRWEWVDGSPLSYERWFAGEPNNAGGIEHCGVMHANPSGQWAWNDLSCDSTQDGESALCEARCPQGQQYQPAERRCR